MFGHRDKNKKFHPHGSSKGGISESDMERNSKDIIKIPMKFDQQRNKEEENYIKKLIETDEKWNKLHGEPKHHHIYGEVTGHPDIDYVFLMKRLGMFSEPNYNQWKRDGHTDKEIYDLFKKYNYSQEK